MELTPELQDRLEAYVKGELPFNELTEMASLIEANPELKEFTELLNGLEVISIKDRLALIHHDLEEKNAFDNEEFDEVDAEIDALFFTLDEIDAKIETLVGDLFSIGNSPSEPLVENSDDSSGMEAPTNPPVEEADDEFGDY